MAQFIFKNYGGSYQLRLQNADDLEKIQTFKESLWAATSIPIDALNCDRKFADYLDSDKNGRIRTDELKNAQAWLFRMLANHNKISQITDVLILEDIDISHTEGQKLRAAAELILNNLNHPEAKEINLNQVRDLQHILASSDNNGDGVITPEGIQDKNLSQFISIVMETIGSIQDAGGKQGIGKEQLDTFYTEAKSYLSWKLKGEIPQEQSKTEIMPWGTETPQAYELIANLENKIDQYFMQCAMVRFDEQSSTQMKLRQKELEEMDFSDEAEMETRLKNAPLAPPDTEGILNLEGNINSLYIQKISDLKEKVLKRILGESIKQLNKEQWNKVKNFFAPYREWLQSKQGEIVEKLGAEKLRTFIDGPYKKQTNSLIAKDISVADYLEQIKNLEKLILYQKYLLSLSNNFVSFANLYNPEIRSLFEAGTLVMDGREMLFAMKVPDLKEHKKIAIGSYMYLLYVEITGRYNNEEIKFNIVAAVTSGDAGDFRIGKRGIFFTRDRKEWDAQVVDIIVNPIGILESIKAPFRQFTAFIGKQVDKFSKIRQDKVGNILQPSSSSGMARDLMVGGGIAIAALGTALAYITKALSQAAKTFSQTPPIHILFVLLGIIAIVFIPSLISGFIKLRKRNMSVILEALGCAVNVHMRLTTNLGRIFTRMPGLPMDSHKQRQDLIAQFVKNVGYSSFNWKRLIIISLATILICLTIYLLLSFRV